MDSLKPLLKTYGVAIGSAILVAILIRAFVIEAYKIPTNAMHPTLEAGDTIFVSKWDLWGADPEKTFTRGDVVVFSVPQNQRFDSIKRIVGMPGETVQITKGRLIVNGNQLTTTKDEQALCGSENTFPRTWEVCWEPPILNDLPPTQVPSGSVFVLGDLRSQPQDVLVQKTWGIVPISLIKGKARWIWLSIEPRTSRTGGFPKIRIERLFKSIQ